MSEQATSDWRHQAACGPNGRYDPELFFPIGTSGPALLQTEQAKDACNSHCSVTARCLAWALESGQDTGVWGGMSESERRALKARGGHLAIVAATRAVEADAQLAPAAQPQGAQLVQNNRSGRS